MPKLKKPIRSLVRRQRREETIAAFKQSGLSQSQFCLQTGVASSTLSKWLRQQHHPSNHGAFTPVAIAADRSEDLQPGASSSTIELYFGDDWRVVLPADFESDSVRRLLKILGGLDVCAA